jgi:magnesium chelatase family protein
MKKLYSSLLDTNIAKTVEVESTFTNGLPSFTIVGLASSDIQESKDRVKSALLHNGFVFPPKKITMNLAPSDLANKKGTHFDLSIALSVAMQNSNKEFEEYYIFGELGLDGKLKNSSSIFPIILSLIQQGANKKFLVPLSSIDILSKIPNIKLYGVDNLQEAIDFFDDNEKYRQNSTSIEYDFININSKKYYYQKEYQLDFADIKGQSIAIRASLIAASGNHNIIYEGSPGSGKSMSAKRLRYIMPPKSLDEILQIAKNEMLDFKEPDFSPLSPFRSPHNSSSKSSIFGGGNRLSKIGEVGLSHNGILFFDEFPHFEKSTLESLREPLEDNKVMISRVNSKIEYDAKFLFIGAQNPCPCGNLLSKSKVCRCNEFEIKRYKNKISDPLMDRIDLYVSMSEISVQDRPTTSSSQMHLQVLKAFANQLKRGQKELNGKLSESDVAKYCKLDDNTQNILYKAIDRFALSNRAINKILKVARTIADLDDSKDIKKSHIMESFNYRKRI